MGINLQPDFNLQLFITNGAKMPANDKNKINQKQNNKQLAEIEKLKKQLEEQMTKNKEQMIKNEEQMTMNEEYKTMIA